MLSKDLSSIVLVATGSSSHPVVYATVSCADIREEFGLRDTSNDLLRDRASVRQTNKDALEELANGLFASGNYTTVQGTPVVRISRPDLATKKDRFAWGNSDLPPILGIPTRGPRTISPEKFEVEKLKVESLMALLGHHNFNSLNPNLKEETGVDVVNELNDRRIGFQVTDFHSDEVGEAAQGGSGLRRDENKRVKQGLPAVAYVNPDPIPGLVQRIKDKLKKRWSKKDFPEVNLLIVASIPDLPGIVSTFIWGPKLEVAKLDSHLSPLLRDSDYAAVYLFNMNQKLVYRWTKEAGWENLVLT
jgi:hypothetical protein